MTTQIRLQEAQDALHQLVIGKKAVKIQKDGRSVEFTPATRSELELYIRQLQSELNTGSMRRPSRVFL
jgi:hypothetical protein